MEPEVSPPASAVYVNDVIFVVSHIDKELYSYKAIWMYGDVLYTFLD